MEPTILTDRIWGRGGRWEGNSFVQGQFVTGHWHFLSRGMQSIPESFLLVPQVTGHLWPRVVCGGVSKIRL